VSLSAAVGRDTIPLLQFGWNEGTSRCVADVQDVDGVAADAIKYPEWIADDRNNADRGPLGYPWR
jgi:hypothetical protein